MPLDINMVYTDNPYIDIIIYNTQLLGIDTVLKMQGQAEKYETTESLKYADKLIMCKEGTMAFELFDSFSEEVLRSCGFIGLPLIQAMANPETIPTDYRPAVLAAACEEFINNYEDLNYYYRMLSGLPPIGHEDYVTDWTPPQGIVIDLSIPVHKMGETAIRILKQNGVLEDMYEEDHYNRAYMKYIDRKIDPYVARKTTQFGVLYIPTIDSAEIEKEYRDRLDVNREYVLRAVYSSAYKFDSDYYDNIMAVFIVLNAMMDVVSRVQEFIARKEVFDLRTCRYIFESHGVDFFPTIPLRYQIRMVKNLHTLLKYKSTSKCMVDICSLFGFDNIEIFKYYLLRTHKYDKATGSYSFTGDVNEDYDLKFVRIPIDEPMADYIRDPKYYSDYDEITEADETWDGGLRHEDVREQHLSYPFNYSRTKYMSIDSIYDIATISAQQSYFFNMLYDNYELEDQLIVNVPAISTERGFKLADLFTFLTSLTHFYYGNKDLIMDTAGKVLYVNGFNFKTDLAALSESLLEMRFDKECQELLDRFNIPTESILTVKQLMDIYTNNLEIRDLLIAGMRNADSLRHYLPYKKMYDALMTVELTFDHFKNPETGDFYRDAEGDATYAAYLAAEDPILYYKLIELQMIEDDDSRVNSIVNLIDNIVYILEEWIDSEEFAGIFYMLPGVSIDAIKQYILQVITFYMSYKVHILGINTLYYFDDPGEGYIFLIDDILLNRWFEKDEVIALVDRFINFQVKMDHKQKIELMERVWLDISRWEYHNLDDYIILRDIYAELLTLLFKDDEIVMEDTISLSTKLESESAIFILDLTERLNKFDQEEKIGVMVERLYFSRWFTESIIDNKYFYLYNVLIPAAGTTTIDDSRVINTDTARFIPDVEYIDLIDGEFTCSCDDGHIIVTSSCNQDIAGTIEISSPTVLN